VFCVQDLVAVLTTHKHHDHAGGNLKLQKLCGHIKLRVYGHVKDRIPGVTTRVKPGDVVKIGETNVGVVHVPCHTDGHVVYCVMGDGGDVDADVEGGSAHPSTAGVPTNDGGGGAGSLPTHKIEAVFTGEYFFIYSVRAIRLNACFFIHRRRHHQRRRGCVFPRRRQRLLR